MGKLCDAQGRSFSGSACNPFHGAIRGEGSGIELCVAQGQIRKQLFR